MTRKPTTPGEILQHEYLAPLEMTQKDLVVTAEVALKLAATFRATPEFWLNAQKAVDLHAARAKLKRKLPKALVAPTRIAG
jgi:plasmid maintenance system antidote protein VapI